jgi:hypothetical protein
MSYARNCKKAWCDVDAAIHAPHIEVDLMNATIMLTSCLRLELLIKMVNFEAKKYRLLVVTVVLKLSATGEKILQI